MPGDQFRFIGRGLYSLREAHRLTGVPPKRIRRWATGYSYRSGGRVHYSPPIVANTLGAELGVLALDFADLLEVRFLNAFRSYGVSWRAIRIASERARSLLGLLHPFSSKKFSTDGRTILAQFVNDAGDPMLLDLVRSQYEFESIIQRYLFGKIEFDEFDNPQKWWPVNGTDRILIDPARAFGAPIVNPEGVPTRVLAAAVATEGSIETVAELFEVDPQSVVEAVAYERNLS